MTKTNQFSPTEKMNIILALRNTRKNLEFLKTRLGKESITMQTTESIEHMCSVFPHFERFMQEKLGMKYLEAKNLSKAKKDIDFWEFFKSL